MNHWLALAVAAVFVSFGLVIAVGTGLQVSHLRHRAFETRGQAVELCAVDKPHTVGHFLDTADLQTLPYRQSILQQAAQVAFKNRTDWYSGNLSHYLPYFKIVANLGM